MKTICHIATLFYYDGPQLFEARDQIGGHYVAVMLPPAEGQDRYLVVGVEPERLRQFRTGTLDLRSLLVERGDPEWYLATVDGGIEQPLSIAPQRIPLLESGFLPEPGFVLHEHASKSEMVKEARERNNLVLEVAIDPPEAAEEHRVHLRTLVGLLGCMQTLVKHAYSTAVRDLSPDARSRIDRTNAYLLDVVVPAAPGSFRMILEAAQMPDLFGQSEVCRALERLDRLFDNVDDPIKVLETVKTNRGHMAGAYLRLLRFLVQTKTGLRYAWAEPNFEQPRARSVSEAEAGPLVEALSGVANLGAETVVLLGALKKADVDNGTWRIATEDREVSGKSGPDSPSLAGLRLESTYRFTCVEEIEETPGGWTEKRTLYLKEHEPA